MSSVPTLKSLCMQQLFDKLHPSVSHRLYRTRFGDIGNLLKENEARTIPSNTDGRIPVCNMYTRNNYPYSPYVTLSRSDMWSDEDRSDDSDDDAIKKIKAFRRSRFTVKERHERRTGQLRTHTDFWINHDGDLEFRLDSYIFPEIWAGGVISLRNDEIEVKEVSGRSSTEGASELSAYIQNGNVLRISDIHSPSFWAEVCIPREYLGNRVTKRRRIKD
jgi:hypothetical protein